MHDIEIISYINDTLGYAPPSITESEDWVRFDTNSKKAGSYKFHSWLYNGKNYHQVLFINFAGDQIVHKYNSWNGQKEFTPEQRIEFHHQVKQRELEAKKALQAQYEAKSEEAEKYFSECSTEPINSVYLHEKKVPEIAGLDKNIRYDKTKNCLVIPCIDIHAKVWSVQTISNNGFKSFFEDAKKKNTFHLIGKRQPDTQLIFVVEGYATGASVHLATQCPVVVCFDAGNLRASAKHIEHFVRLKSPNALLVFAGDDDRFTTKPPNPGRHAVQEAVKDLVGARWILPKFKNPEMKLTDFNDLHVTEGLKEVSYQLSKEFLIDSMKNVWYESKGCLWSILKVDKDDKKGVPSIEDKKCVTNYIIKKDYEIYDEEARELTRYVTIQKGAKTQANLPFKNTILRTSSEFETWLYGKETGLMNYGPDFNITNLKRHLDEMQVPRITIKDKFGKMESGQWLFRNCLIQNGEIKTTGKYDCFLQGYDASGQEIGIKLKDSLYYFAPELDLKTPENEIKDLTAELIDCLVEGYGNHALMALGYTVSTLFMDTIGKLTHTNQFPTLSLYGEPHSGKSNLLRTLEYLHGFHPDKKLYSGIAANSTKASIENVLTRSRNLLVCIMEIKPEDRQNVEELIQRKYDGQLRQKSARDKLSGEWVPSFRESQCAMACDSNHLFQMESVIDRLIPLEFQKQTFKLESVKKLNKSLSKLSAITRWLILNTDEETYAKGVLQVHQSLLARNVNSRQSLGIAICVQGIGALIKLAGKDYSNLQLELDKWILDNYKDGIQQLNQLANIAHGFFEYYFSTFARQVKLQEKLITIPADQTVIYQEELGTKEIFIPLKTMLMARLEYCKGKAYSPNDLLKACQHYDLISKWNRTKYMMGRNMKICAMSIDKVKERFEIFEEG